MKRRGAELLAGDRALSEVVMETPGAMAAAAGAQRDLVAAMEALIRRGQEAGVLRDDRGLEHDDATAADVDERFCRTEVDGEVASPAEAQTPRPGHLLSKGCATKKPHAYPESWRRHLAIVLDGLRAESARNRLPS